MYSYTTENIAVADRVGDTQENTNNHNIVAVADPNIINYQEIKVNSMRNQSVKTALKIANKRESGHYFNINFRERNIYNNLMKSIQHLNKFPDLNPILSDHQFKVNITRTGSPYCLYSENLNKIYIRMNNVITMEINYKPLGETLYLRAMLVFTSPCNMHQPIIRCAHHRTKSLSNEIPDFHVLRCSHPGSIYLGHEEGEVFKDRSSILIPLDNIRVTNGIATECIGFQFMCQNSCVSGINRKPAAIVLTLETKDCVIVGKSVTNFKACSCPKRDYEKDEPNLNQRKRKHDNVENEKQLNKTVSTDSTNGFTIKSEPLTCCQTDSINEIQLLMPNAKSMYRILNLAQNDIYGQLARKEITPDAAKVCLRSITSQLDDFSKLVKS